MRGREPWGGKKCEGFENGVITSLSSLVPFHRKAPLRRGWRDFLILIKYAREDDDTFEFRASAENGSWQRVLGRNLMQFSCTPWTVALTFVQQVKSRTTCGRNAVLLLQFPRSKDALNLSSIYWIGREQKMDKFISFVFMLVINNEIYCL